jgi:hypothetical protein
MNKKESIKALEDINDYKLALGNEEEIWKCLMVFKSIFMSWLKGDLK